MNDLIDLNESCFCMPIDRQALDENILTDNPIDGLDHMLTERTSLFAGTAVFVSQWDIQSMLSHIRAIEAVAELEGYQKHALGRHKTPVIHAQPETHSLLMGYDFHMTSDGPRLIEINTNAGGAFLVKAMETALSLNPPVCGDLAVKAPVNIQSAIAAMFVTEWQSAGRDGKPETIAIIDEEPSRQYLFPDMLLARALLQKQGIRTLILDPDAVSYDGEALRAGDHIIDVVYNRLTDFHLKTPRNLPIRMALLDDKCVVSPAPRHHALYADKRNLVVLSDLDRLEAWGLDRRHLEALENVPETLIVSEQDPDALWARRKRYFFKPASGFGSRATYRGDKLTKRVWEEILRGDYVAQRFVAPSRRGLNLDDIPTNLKFDLRVYTYAGQPLLYAARVYQGQTTNFRTKGGGFAPVIQVA